METHSLSREKVHAAPRFTSPEEELLYLRERVQKQQERIGTLESQEDQNRIAKREIAAYADMPAAHVLHEDFVMPEHEAIRAKLSLEPEVHDRQVDELLKIVESRGIKNALSVLARMNDPHLEDDLHRVLVRYVAEGFPKTGAAISERLSRALNLTLFEIRPQTTAQRTKDSLKEILASSEQLYSGLLSLLKDHDSFSLEVAVAQGSEEAILYCAVPREKASIAERLVRSVFPGAGVSEVRGDYNVFSESGAHAGAVVMLAKHPIFPLKTYETFQHDPLDVVLAAFSKFAKHGEGAALQIVVGSEGDRYNGHYQKIQQEYQKKGSLKDALDTPETFMGEFMQDVTDVFFSSKKKEGEPQKHADPATLELLRKKTSSRIVPVNIRIVASADRAQRAQDLVGNIIAPLSQFDDPSGNRFECTQLSGSALKNLLHSFTFRLLESSQTIPISMAELTTLFHFTAERVETSRELKKARGKQAPAPVAMPSDGIILGINRFGEVRHNVHFGVNDRLRHCYVVGQTGTGKTTLIKNMIRQDIQNGEGVAFIDPHGNDIEDILASIPSEREDDVIYFDPAHTEHPMGLNMLEYDRERPEMKTMIVDELYGIFRKLFPDVPEAFGPMFEQYYRNATMLVMDDPESGNTLLEIPRVFASAEFRRHKIARCSNPIVVQFWRDIAEKTGGEHALENMTPWITSKFDPFLANDIMRPIVAQERSAFRFREVMDSKKIFLANLSKGRLGEKNMALLGLVLVSKFAQAAFSRADARGDLSPFYLYIDEFQNFMTPSITSILSEARKYKLSLTIAHQFIAQLEESIRDAVIGNVGTKCVFRVGATDAEFLEKQFAPTFTARDLEGMENYNAAVSLLVRGVPASPFSIETEKPPPIDYGRVDRIKQLSYARFGRPRGTVEDEIRAKFVRPAPPKP